MSGAVVARSVADCVANVTLPCILTFGETMGLFYAERIGPPNLIGQFRFGLGGAEGNVAIGAVALGGRAQWIGRVGPDATGAAIIARFAAAGVEATAIADEAFSGLMVRHHHSGEATQIDYHRAGSAGSHLVPGDIPVSAVRAAGVVHVTGITPALSAGAAAAVAHAVDVAHEAGVGVSLDVNYRSKLWSRSAAAAALGLLAPRADIVFASPEEAVLLLPRGGPIPADPLELARAIAALGPSEVVIKTGAAGCVALIGGVAYTQRARAVTVVDSVGAGDAFVAGYLVDRLAGARPEDRLATAVAAGTFAVTVPGDADQPATRNDIARAATNEVTR